MSLLLVQGNTLNIPLADKSVQCIVTSPPYWGLRSYAGTAKWEGGDPECDHLQPQGQRQDVGRRNVDGFHGSDLVSDLAAKPYRDVCRKCGARRHDAQLGSEALHDCLGWATGNDCGECYICHMRQVARECWRVLRDDGVMFWNIADSYNGSGGAGGDYNEGGLKEGQPRFNGRKVSSLKPKDKCGIPERTALAFQADGWYWRSDIIWHKPNPMPESVTDRCTKSHEFVYVFTKQERYYWDAEAVREDGSNNSHGGGNNWGKWVDIANRTESAWNGIIAKPAGESGRNLRDVWTMATQAYPGAHFATYPSELPRRCIKAATSERGACPKCGKPWERITEIEYKKGYRTGHLGFRAKGDIGGMVDMSNYPALDKHTTTIGWRPGCECTESGIANRPQYSPSEGSMDSKDGSIPDPVPCIVLDPFSGAATTGLVARELGRHYVGLELSGEYLQQSRERLGLAALEAWTGGNGNGKHTNLDDLPMFKNTPMEDAK